MLKNNELIFSDKRFGDLETNRYAQIALEANEIYHYMWQEDEIAEAMRFLDENLTDKSNGFIEIGSAMGGSFHCWGKIMPNGVKISVDLPLVDTGTTFPDFVSETAHKYAGNESDGIKYRLDKWKEHHTDVHQVLGSSLSDATVEEVEKLLDGKKVDFLFIDGDHSYGAIKSDFEKYKKFVRPGGYVGFHDIIGYYSQYWVELRTAYPTECVEITSQYLRKHLHWDADARGIGLDRNGTPTKGAGIGMYHVPNE